jgi:alanyl aminopeptidase
MTVREKMSLSDALSAGFATGALDASSVYEALEPLALDADRYVASSTFGLIRFARERLAADETEKTHVMTWAHGLFSERARALGFDAGPNEDGEARLLRSQIVRFATTLVRDPVLRAEAARRGRQYLGGEPGTPDETAAASELLRLVAKVAVRDGGAAEFDAALAHLVASDDATVRGHMLDALGHSDDPELAERARELLFDDRLRANERFDILRRHAGRRETREQGWQWVQRRFDEVVKRVTPQHGASLLSSARGFCSKEEAQAVSAFFAERIAELEGGPRRLASTIEGIRLCAAKVDRHRAAAQAYFESEVSVLELQ